MKIVWKYMRKAITSVSILYTISELDKNLHY